MSFLISETEVEPAVVAVMNLAEKVFSPDLQAVQCLCRRMATEAFRSFGLQNH